jgi:hypothetical protein
MPLVKQRMDEAIADRRLSPSELESVREYAKSIGIVLEFTPDCQPEIERFSLL